MGLTSVHHICLAREMTASRSEKGVEEDRLSANASDAQHVSASSFDKESVMAT